MTRKTDQLPFYYDWFPWWHPTLESTHRKLLAVAPNYYVDDIKEKFGYLRLQIRTPAWADVEETPETMEAIQDIVDRAEEEAETIE